jgi:hypothetical protein
VTDSMTDSGTSSLGVRSRARWRRAWKVDTERTVPNSHSFALPFHYKLSLALMHSCSFINFKDVIIIPAGVK